MVHPYPTPKLGISARHAVSNLSGCGGGAPHPIVTPHPWRGGVVGRVARSKLVAASLPCFTRRELVLELFRRSEQLWSVVLLALGPSEVDLVGGSVF